MVVDSERRMRRSAPKVRLTVQNNHAVRAHRNKAVFMYRQTVDVIEDRSPFPTKPSVERQDALPNLLGFSTLCTMASRSPRAHHCCRRD